MKFDFPASHRINNKTVFESALKLQGKSNKWFSIHVTRNSLEYCRLGMVVSKRIIPLSVDRNKVKRLIRELFRHNSVVCSGLDLIIRVKQNPGNQFREEARNALLQLMLQAFKS